MTLQQFLLKNKLITGPLERNSSYSHCSRILDDLLGIARSDKDEDFFIFGRALHERFYQNKYEAYSLLSEEEKKRIEVMLKKLHSHPVVKRLMVNATCEDKKYATLYGVLMSYILDAEQEHCGVGSDLKTTTSKTWIDCMRRAIQYGYPKQSKLYKLFRKLKQFYFIFIDKYPPHGIYIISSKEFKAEEKVAEKEVEFLLYFYKHYGELIV